MTDLSSVNLPVAKAKGLPNEHYLSDDIFEEEKHAIMFANWAGVGFGKDIPNSGDAIPVDFLSIPLVLIRDDEGRIRVFQNTCRHRGMILVREKTNIRGTIRCPYHSWCYGLDGRLRSTPHVGGPGHNIHEEIRRDELGLIELRSHVFMDVVFVNIDGKAAEFEEAHKDLIKRWEEFSHVNMYHNGDDSAFTLDVKTNWKLAVENYCESYHLPWVHPGLNSYSRLEDHYNIEARGRFSGQGTQVYRQLKLEGETPFPDFGALSSKWDESAEYIALYPNVLIGVHRDHIFSIVLEPLSTCQTVERISLYYASPLAIKEAYAAMRAENTKLWHTVFEEDIFVVEGMQKGRQGPYFDGGKFAPLMDSPTHMFHEWVANQVLAHRGA